VTTHYHNKDQNKDFYYYSISPTKNKAYKYDNIEKYRPDPYTQQLILETSIVNAIQNQIAHGNAFELRHFRLRLEMETA
jgi:hypothetical protein